MRPCGTKLSLQFGKAVHARKAYGNDPLIDTFIYLQRLNGAVVIDNGHHTGTRPGRVVYGPGYKGK
jgi:hypothetical protein